MAARTRRPRPDEGYSDGLDECYQADSESSMQIDPDDDDASVQDAQGRMLNLSVNQRDTALAGMFANLQDEEKQKLFVLLAGSLPSATKEKLLTSAVDSLPTAAIARISDAVWPRLHLDPASRLPSELTELIINYLRPEDAVRISMTSKTWKQKSLDTRQWKAFYLREGWMVNVQAISELLDPPNAKHGARRSHVRKFDSSVEARSSRKRQRESARAARGSSGAADTEAWGVQHDEPEADDGSQMEGVESSPGGRSTLGDVEDLAALSPASPGQSPPHQGGLLQEDPLARLQSVLKSRPDIHKFPASSLLSDYRTMNWHHLYKQRRRLESNWNEGRYASFQLPHPSYPEEMHDECVYTIQFVGNWLVSGSRDKTIKIWDLETKRCKRTLSGEHEQSVLCMQFDPDKDEDIIVSGGSDSYIVIWQFSTGKVIKKMTLAHSESVLNLRFDSRYLITCSKDKTIKIWNRRTIMSDDVIVPMALKQKHVEPVELEPYSLLGTLDGHNAAVNAIQVYGDTIVSASGDRHIRMWSINTGECIREVAGHTKGIACVQFDGRRIISGSSDNTVRIYDASTQGELARLEGHSALVRTVQARFGDREVTDEELEVMAKKAQDKWVRDNNQAFAMPACNVPEASGFFRELNSLNNKIPQGGGGSRWCRIVSGSYDETVIIWKKDADGRWVVGRRLHQDEVLSHPRNRPNRAQRPAFPMHVGHQGHGHAHAHGHAQVPPPNPPGPPGPAAVRPPVQQAQPPAQQAAPQNPPPAAPGAAPPLRTAPAQAQAAHHHHHHHHPPNVATMLQQQQQRHMQTLAQQMALQHRQMVQARRMQNQPDESSNRVFKLQFDSRRLICCSQNKIIVGWDFANGDPYLQEASRYFTETD